MLPAVCGVRGEIEENILVSGRVRSGEGTVGGIDERARVSQG